MAALGKKTLGLGYGLITTDLVLAPAIPSNTARAGGIVFPLAKSSAKAFGSEPDDGTARKIGAFLIQAAFQGNVVTSAMFLTAMAANPLATKLAGEIAHQCELGAMGRCCSRSGDIESGAGAVVYLQG